MGKSTISTVYAGEAAPYTLTRSVFLAGPTPREEGVQSWRKECLALLDEVEFDGVVFVPEPRDGNWTLSNLEQIEWEELHLEMADCILFWVPRCLTTLPGFTTNVEFGRWEDSGKIVFGAPANTPKNRYLLHYAEKHGAPMADTLADTIAAAVDSIGEGVERTGGQRGVPAYIWHTPPFQQWHQAQVAAGNRLDGAKVEWVFRVGPKRNLFIWALHVKVWITSEGRHKSNEVVIARPDISTVVAYRRAAIVDESTVVLIREFRSPATTADGYVHEVPGGSSFNPNGDPLRLASDELREETGLHIDTGRLVSIGARQLVSTLSTHKAHAYAVEITEEEEAWLRAQADTVRGVDEDTERTWVEVTTVGTLQSAEHVDWSMLGMILHAVTRR